jgi:hypothetical protein
MNTDEHERTLIDLLIFVSAVGVRTDRAGLRGTVTDPSGAVPGALVQLRGPGVSGGEPPATTVWRTPRDGTVRSIARGFSVTEKRGRDHRAAGDRRAADWDRRR